MKAEIGDEQSSTFKNLADSFMRISDELDRVRELMKFQFSSGPEAVQRLLTTFDCCGGKMLRAGLVMLSGSCCGKITDEHINAAAILEMIHTATLLHDDVIDEGRIRRGLPTVNMVYGNESAVLLGDFLLCKVFQMCAGFEPQAVKMIATAIGRICQGELTQIFQRKNFQLSEAEYINIITEKTAVLFAACCQLGAFLSKADERQIQNFYDFGINAGIAFQIIDDLEDMIGDQEKAGKTLTRDLYKKNVTLAMIHLLKQADRQDRKFIEEKVLAGQEKCLIEMLRSQGSLEYAQEKARAFAEKAIAAISGIKNSQAKDSLITLADFAARRVV